MKLWKTVEWFSQQMQHKLYQNRNKNHWSGSNYDYLKDRLLDEYEEMSEQLRMLQASEKNLLPSDAWTKEECKKIIIQECADIANIAMMIADNIRTESK
jgi:hypothetical protein